MRLVITVDIELAIHAEPERHEVEVTRVCLGRAELPVLARKVACGGELEVALGFLLAVVDDVEGFSGKAEVDEAVPGVGFEGGDGHFEGWMIDFVAVNVNGEDGDEDGPGAEEVGEEGELYTQMTPPGRQAE